ncbi:MAG: hypothetical protein U1E56_01565 [Bauldia sp.]
MVRSLVGATLGLLASVSLALAQGGTVQRVKLRALLADGYELKNIVFIPNDASSRIAATADKDALLLSLQKGQQIATCFLSAVDYLTGAALDIEWCIPHK